MLAIRRAEAADAAAVRALTRDAYTFQEMPLVMSWISLGQNIAPSLAPMLGGFLAAWLSWRATFWFVGAFGVTLLLVVFFGLRETNKFRSDKVDLGALLRGSGEMLRSRRFLGHILPLGFGFAINFGMLAGRFATPMIVPPQVAIVGVGRIENRMVLTPKGKAKVRMMIPLSLSFDHRVLTGAEAAAFLAALMHALQKNKGS